MSKLLNQLCNLLGASPAMPVFEPNSEIDMPPREKATQSAIVAYLEALPRAVVRVRGPGYGYRKGDPDVYALINGIHYEIEVKQLGKKPDKRQVVLGRQWQAAGALYCVATCVEDVERLVEG